MLTRDTSEPSVSKRDSFKSHTRTIREIPRVWASVPDVLTLVCSNCTKDLVDNNIIAGSCVDSVIYSTGDHDVVQRPPAPPSSAEVVPDPIDRKLIKECFYKVILL
jgi:hypothetical protein